MEERAKKAGTYCFWAAVLIELLLVIIDKSAYINPYEGQLFRLTFFAVCSKDSDDKVLEK